jgi:hypothetical protein
VLQALTGALACASDIWGTPQELTGGREGFDLPPDRAQEAGSRPPHQGIVVDHTLWSMGAIRIRVHIHPCDVSVSHLRPVHRDPPCQRYHLAWRHRRDTQAAPTARHC